MAKETIWKFTKWNFYRALIGDGLYELLVYPYDKHMAYHYKYPEGGYAYKINQRPSLEVYPSVEKAQLACIKELQRLASLDLSSLAKEHRKEIKKKKGQYNVSEELASFEEFRFNNQNRINKFYGKPLVKAKPKPAPVAVVKEEPKKIEKKKATVPVKQDKKNAKKKGGLFK